MSETYAYNYLSRQEMLAFVPDSALKILEVGCGDGSFAVQLTTRKDSEIWGVEKHEYSAEIASGRLHKVISGDFESIIGSQLPVKYFDCIIFNDVLEHFHYPERVLIRIKELLVPHGFVVASIPNFRYVGNLLEILIKKDFQYKSSGILDYTHFRFFTQKSINRMFAESGYELKISKGINGTNSLKVKLFNIIILNYFSDIKFMQIGIQAQLTE
ncbi:MAG TPA: class I SAM-dependent methyltransferase [Bacteroidales bacterium]|nr:class I SAM-dependent methyltransferase [Bacteroidales bacterium]